MRKKIPQLDARAPDVGRNRTRNGALRWHPIGCFDTKRHETRSATITQRAVMGNRRRTCAATPANGKRLNSSCGGIIDPALAVGTLLRLASLSKICDRCYWFKRNDRSVLDSTYASVCVSNLLLRTLGIVIARWRLVFTSPSQPSEIPVIAKPSVPNESLSLGKQRRIPERVRVPWQQC